MKIIKNISCCLMVIFLLGYCFLPDKTHEVIMSARSYCEQTIDNTISDIKSFTTKDDIAFNTSSEADQLVMDNIDVLCDYFNGNWEELSTKEKVKHCQMVANIEAERLSLGHKLKVKKKDLDENTIGQYQEDGYLILIDDEHLQSDEAVEVLNTVLHEAYHSYEYCLVTENSSKDSGSDNPLLKMTADTYDYEFNHYIDGEEDFEGYYAQKMESDARLYAERECEYYCEIVRSYMG